MIIALKSSPVRSIEVRMKQRKKAPKQPKPLIVAGDLVTRLGEAYAVLIMSKSRNPGLKQDL